MGAGGVPNRIVKVIEGKRGDLPTKVADYNSRYDLYVNGKKVQSRWFDFEGNVVLNRDYDHQDSHNNHKFPHDHKWVWKNGHPDRKKDTHPDYENFK